MNKVVLLFFFAYFIAIADNAFPFPENRYYAGFGIQQSKIGFENGHGYELFRKSATGGEAMLGYRFYDNLGIELKFSKLPTKSMVSTLNNPSLAGGLPILGSLSPAVFKSKINFYNYSVNFFYFYNQQKIANLEFFLSAGPSVCISYGTRQTLSISGYERIFLRKFKGRSINLNLSAGLNYKLNNNSLVRIYFGYVDLGNLLLKENDGIASYYIHQLKPNNIHFLAFDLIFPF